MIIQSISYDFHDLNRWSVENLCDLDTYFIVNQEVSFVLLLKNHSFCKLPYVWLKYVEMHYFLNAIILECGDHKNGANRTLGTNSPYYYRYYF